MVHAVCSHGYGLVSDVKPEHQMEKVLFAIDELTGLIGAAAQNASFQIWCWIWKWPGLKKKFKDKKFAAGCSREVITQGAQMLGWELDELFLQTILAMRESEAQVQQETQSLCQTQQ